MSGFQVARIAAHLFNTPLLLQPETAIAIASNLAERFGVEPIEPPASAPEASRFRGKPAGIREDGRPMYRAENGIAVISVLGELVNRGAWIGASSGLTSYEGLEAQLRGADDDPNIAGILLDLNSPGGEATGAMETGALVRAIAGRKPVVAFVNGMAASAGYAIAAGATKIVTTPTGIAGSIGVVMLHLDRSGQLAKAGVKPTLIHAGAHKVDGTSLQALPDDARARIQASIDELYALFVDHVAALRKLDAGAVRATEGGVLMGATAVASGLADKVGTFEDAFALLKPKQTLKTGAFSMDTITKAEHETALRAQADRLGTEHAAALAAAGPAAISADRARTKAILAAPEAKGREALAQRLAFGTDLAAEAAIDMLKDAPQGAASDAARRPRLGVEDPKLAADVAAPDKASDWSAIGKEIGALA